MPGVVIEALFAGYWEIGQQLGGEDVHDGRFGLFEVHLAQLLDIMTTPRRRYWRDTGGTSVSTASTSSSWSLWSRRARRRCCSKIGLHLCDDQIIDSGGLPEGFLLLEVEGELVLDGGLELLALLVVGVHAGQAGEAVLEGVGWIGWALGVVVGGWSSQLTHAGANAWLSGVMAASLGHPARMAGNVFCRRSRPPASAAKRSRGIAGTGALPLCGVLLSELFTQP